MHKSKLIKFVLIIKNCCFPYFSNFTKIFIKLYFCSSSINCTYNMGGKNRFDQNEQCASVVSIQKNCQNNTTLITWNLYKRPASVTVIKERKTTCNRDVQFFRII